LITLTLITLTSDYIKRLSHKKFSIIQDKKEESEEEVNSIFAQNDKFFVLFCFVLFCLHSTFSLTLFFAKWETITEQNFVGHFAEKEKKSFCSENDNLKNRHFGFVKSYDSCNRCKISQTQPLKLCYRSTSRGLIDTMKSSNSEIDL